MMSGRNKAVVRQLIEEVWSRGNYDFVDQLVAGDFVGHGTIPMDAAEVNEVQGQEGYKLFYRTLRQAFPDLQVTVADQIAEGDAVVTRWMASGTNTGEFQGMPATGNRGTVCGAAIYRLANGKVVEGWGYWEQVMMLQLLGVMPAYEEG